MRSSRRTWIASAALGALAALVSSSPSVASWPMARQNAARTASAPGKSDFLAPIPYWRTYLGGSLTNTSFAMLDVDGDGYDDAIYGSGGRVVAKKTNDTGIWQTKPRGLGSVYAIADLDGDGVQDIVSTNSNHAVVVKATTGEVEWTEPDGEMGSLGGLRVGDIDGDGKAEVIVQECGCCGVNSGKTGFAYSFAGGFAAPKLVFTMPFVSCGGGRAQTLVDVDGDGKQEMLLGAFDHFELFDGKTSTKLGATGAIASYNGIHICKPHDLDGKPGEEVVCLLNDSNTGQRRITVLRYDGGAQALNVLWSNVVAPASGGDLRWVDPVVDLDGDGVFEVVASTYDANAGGWKAHVYDALTGVDAVSPLAGHVVAGSAETAKKGSQTLFTNAGGNLYGWTFVRAPNPSLTQQWQLADRAVVSFTPIAKGARYSANATVVTGDFDHDGLTDFVTRSASGSAALVAYSGAGGTTKLLGTRTLPAGVDVQQAWSVTPKHSGDPQLALSRTDGFLELLDDKLGVAQCCGEFPQPLVIRVGGYYAAGGWRQLTNGPRTFAMKQGAPDSIFVSDSRGALLRFDPKDASLIAPPTATWSLPGTFAPTVVANLDGTAPGIACYASDQAGRHVRALRADGTTAWDVPIERDPLGDLVPGNLNGDTTPDFVAQWGDPADVVLHTRALSGLDGSKLWDATPVSPGSGRQPAGVSLGRWDGDALDDVYQQGPGTYVLSGANGSKLGSGGTGDSYFMPIPVDTTGDGVDEVVLHAGYSPVRLYSHDLGKALYTSADDDRPYPYGAIAKCGADTVLVEGSWQHPGRLKLTTLSGSALGTVKTMVLASGAAYPDESAANGAYFGQLTSAAVHQNLTGKGRPTAVVGSIDGFVYGVDPCTGNVDFAVSLGVATGEVIFGDTDGDGRDELLVSAADGYLYDLKNKAIDAPSPVLDTDPQKGVTSTDVDTTTQTTSLSASWPAVTGATSYSVAIVDAQGKIIKPWSDVGTVTNTTVTGLTLSIGARYTFAVRANSTTGPSVDSTSNGVTIVATVPDAGPPPADDGGVFVTDAGPDGGVAPAIAEEGGCGCDLAGAGRSSAVGFGAAAIAFAAALRRRRR